MKRIFDYSTIDLEGRVEALGPHHQKYIANIQKNFDALVALIDEKRLIDQFSLLRFSLHPARDMKRISGFVADRAVLLDLLGCYYSLQFLLLNIKALDVLQLNLATAANRYHVFRNFLQHTGNDFRLLSGAYMSTLLDLFFIDQKRPDFVVCSVGTRVDQDDIDIGVIDSGSDGRQSLNAAFGFLNTEMLKNASALHFHLSEHVGGHGYSASIPEYHALLDNQIQDFVILSEMLNAVPILGNLQLFHQFKSEILERYYFHPGQDNRYHEGCLRGLLGEIRDLVMRDPAEDVIDPKDDGLRMIKAVIFSLKTWKHIDAHVSLDLIDILMRQDPANYEYYNRIYEAFTFIETFRFLYQLFVVQEEQIDISNSSITASLEQVARFMGYEKKSYAPAHAQLLIHYHDHLRRARTGAEALIKLLADHLHRNSVFYPLTHFNDSSIFSIPYRGNLAVDFMQYSKFFSGTRFWDDFLNAMDQQDEILLDRFLSDLTRLSPWRRRILIDTYVRWGSQAPYTLISLLIIITKHRPELIESEIIRQFAGTFIGYLRSNLLTISRLSRVLIFYPRTMNNFLAMLPPELLQKLVSLIDLPVWRPDVNAMKNRLVSLGRLYLHSSYFFKRFIHNVFNKYAHYIISLNNAPKFRQLADGLLRNLDNFETIDEKKEKLGDYYDFEFLRIGMNAVNGHLFETINHEFTLFSDNYIQILFELCKEEVAVEMRNPPETRDLLAIFAAGGHARSQAFDDDYDLIILLNSDNQRILAFANQIILRMNKHIIKRSIMPHYRFADRFKRYVTTFGELKDFFRTPDDYAFIDQSQLLGARLVVGSSHFLAAYEKELVEPFIFQNKNQFIRFIIQEIQSRHQYHTGGPTLNIKESPGGLRDLENFLMILKAFYGQREPISDTLFAYLEEQLSDHSDLLRQLARNYYFLKHVRDLYHLMVSDDDELQPALLDTIVPPLRQSRQMEIPDAGALEMIVCEKMQQNNAAIHSIIPAIGFHFFS